MKTTVLKRPEDKKHELYNQAGAAELHIGCTDTNGCFFTAFNDAAKPALSFPTEFSIDQNFPNPFNPATTIGFTLPQASPVVLAVYNTVGERVATLVDGVYPAGSYAVEWDAREYASGIYIYRIQAGSYTATNKMMLLK